VICNVVELYQETDNILEICKDGVIATFNLRGEDDIGGTNEDAISAVNAALDFREAFKAIKFPWHEEWKSKANETIEFGLKCGISNGYVLLKGLK
jgi:hypothetical protein